MFGCHIHQKISATLQWSRQSPPLKKKECILSTPFALSRSHEPGWEGEEGEEGGRERERGAGPGRRAVIRPPITGENGEFFPRCRTDFNWLYLAIAIAGVRARTQSRSTS